MIDLSINTSYLSRYYGISTARAYSGPNVAQAAAPVNDDLMNIVTQDGLISVDPMNLEWLLQDPNKLAEIMKLQDLENRYLIIQQLPPEDLAKILPLLTSEQLSFGLQYFTTDGLMELINALPPEEMVNLLLVHFTMEDVVPFMEVGEMSEFFESTHLEKRDVFEYFEGLEYEKFQSLMVNQFGIEYKDKYTEEYLYEIENMEDKQYMQFLQNLQTFEKAEAIAGLCEINPDYYLEFDNSVLSRPIYNELEKEDIIKTMKTLEPEFLVPMIQELPTNLIQVVATQIDPSVFSDMLASEFPDMLVEMLSSG